MKTTKIAVLAVLSVTINIALFSTSRAQQDASSIRSEDNAASLVVPVNLVQVSNSMVYPEAARQMEVEGKVTIRVLVDTDGSVIETGTVTGPEIFYDEVRNKAMMLQFTPRLQSGKPVKAWGTVRFSFKLSD